MGSKRKVWLESPDNASYLFKYVRQDAVGSVYGDDWAEKLAAELARLLGLPAATVDLASRGGDPEVVCRRVNDPAVLELAHGNELLGARESGYDMTLKREHPRYTVPVVQGCIGDAGAPAAHAELRDLTAFDVWAGYLVFDAWIANTDRHHENWGVLVDRQDGSRRLAPSFDHGSSLGFNQSPSSIATKVNDIGALERWCARGRSNHFAGKPSLVDVAAEALDLAGHAAWLHWTVRLRRLASEDWNGLIRRVPTTRMSGEARTFVSRVLEINRRRLLDVCDRAA
jgi:hypothetical protein